MRGLIMLAPVLAVALAAGTVHAEGTETDTAASSSPAPAQVLGESTRGWTTLQTSGSAASSEARPLPGDVAKNVYERYANSFKHPIPEKFERDSFSTKEE